MLSRSDDMLTMLGDRTFCVDRFLCLEGRVEIVWGIVALDLFIEEDDFLIVGDSVFLGALANTEVLVWGKLVRVRSIIGGVSDVDC